MCQNLIYSLKRQSFIDTYLFPTSISKFQLSLLRDIQLSCHWGASSYFYSKQIRLMYQVLTHCGFSWVSPDGNCVYVHWGSFTSNSRSVRRAIWFTWFSETQECIQHLAVLGGHPSNYESGATLLNFSDRANHDERTPYSVYKSDQHLFLWYANWKSNLPLSWLYT